MIKTLIVLATLTLLASCTMPGTTPAQVAPQKQMTPETKMMSGTDTTSMEKKTMTPDTTPKVDTMMLKDTIEKPVDTIGKSETMMKKESGYQAYSPALVSSALVSGQKVVLFFHAGWCPSCRSLDGAINSSLSSISADTLIIKVDYDTSTELKKKYGVVTQHTTVVLNSDGSKKSKKIGASTVAEVVGE